MAGRGYQEDVIITPLLKELMIDPVEHRWAQHGAVTTFRCRHGTVPPDLRKKLKSVDHGRTTAERRLRKLRLICHVALPQPLEQHLFPIALPLFETLFPMNYKKRVLLFVLKGSKLT